MTTPTSQTTPATTHVVAMVEEGTINPRYRCTCGWSATAYNAADRAMAHISHVAAVEYVDEVLAPSEDPALFEDPLTCMNCGEPLELTSDRTLVTVLSGDLGGTYDMCEGTPFDELEGTYGPHKRLK